MHPDGIRYTKAGYVCVEDLQYRQVKGISYSPPVDGWACPPSQCEMGERRWKTGAKVSPASVSWELGAVQLKRLQLKVLQYLAEE